MVKILGPFAPSRKDPLHRGLVAGHVVLVVAVEPRVNGDNFLKILGKNHRTFTAIRTDFNGLTLGTLLVGPHAKMVEAALLHGVPHGGDHLGRNRRCLCR